MRLGRLLALVALIGAVAASTAAAAGITITWPSDGPLRLAFVGDSITDGASSVDWRNQLRYQVLTALEQHGTVTMTTLGKGGVTVAYWAARRMPADQDLVVVELGTNDARITPTPSAAQVAKFAATYRRLVTSIRAKSPKAKLVCLSVWHPVGAPGSATAYNAAIQRECRGAYVNITPLGTKARLGPDGFHPNDLGHEAIARAALHVIRVA